MKSFPRNADPAAAPRPLEGYAGNPPKVTWPNNAKVALNFVLNFEEGGENCLTNQDKQSEHLLSEIIGATPIPSARHANMESMYEYGSRAGYWRLHKLFTKRNLPVTVFAVGKALELNPLVAESMKEAGWEVASHGWRWIDYHGVDEQTEREHIQHARDIHTKYFGAPPAGIYQGKPNIDTRRLVVEAGFKYDSDSYADDLPYWNCEYGKPHLIIPYTLSENDMRFVTASGFSNGREFAAHLIDTLDALRKEGAEGAPKMMSVGLHCRIVGRPGRAAGLEAFLEHVADLAPEEVWVCKREEIADHWYRNHWPDGY